MRSIPHLEFHDDVVKFGELFAPDTAFVLRRASSWTIRQITPRRSCQGSPEPEERIARCGPPIRGMVTCHTGVGTVTSAVLCWASVQHGGAAGGRWSEPRRHLAQTWSLLPESVLVSWMCPEWGVCPLGRDAWRAIATFRQAFAPTNLAPALSASICGRNPYRPPKLAVAYCPATVMVARFVVQHMLRTPCAQTSHAHLVPALCDHVTIIVRSFPRRPSKISRLKRSRPALLHCACPSADRSSAIAAEHQI